MAIAPELVRMPANTHREPPRTLERAATEMLQGLRNAETAARHLALCAEILSTLDLQPGSEVCYEELVRDLGRFAAVLRTRAASLRGAVPVDGGRSGAAGGAAGRRSI